MGCCGIDGNETVSGAEINKAMWLSNRTSSMEQAMPTSPLMRSVKATERFSSLESEKREPSNEYNAKGDQKSGKNRNLEVLPAHLSFSRDLSSSIIPEHDDGLLWGKKYPSWMGKQTAEKEDSPSANTWNEAGRATAQIFRSTSVVVISEERTPYIHLSRSPSLVNIVSPDNNASEDKVISDAETTEKLRNENLRQEKKIQLLMVENRKLKRSGRTSRNCPAQSGRIREKINDIKRQSWMKVPMQSVPLIAEVTPRDSMTTVDNIPPEIHSPPLKFEVSAEEARERRQKSIPIAGRKQVVEENSAWTYSEFLLL